MKLTQREKDLGWCEEAQTYCSAAEERYKIGFADGKAYEREKVINDIRKWLHKTFDKQNNIESKFVPSIVLNEMVFALLDNYLDSNK